jgi:hypothetical protein
MRRRFVLALATLGLAAPALAHHGWNWTASGDFALTGVIVAVKLGNPHGILTIEAEGETWLAEIGQPWRNARAGLTDDLLKVGTEVTLSGHRSADPAELRMKVERVTIAGRIFDLYPDRD